MINIVSLINSAPTYLWQKVAIRLCNDPNFYKKVLKALSCLVVTSALVGVLLFTSKDLGNVVFKEEEVMHLEMINYTTEKNLESFNETNHLCEGNYSLDKLTSS